MENSKTVFSNDKLISKQRVPTTCTMIFGGGNHHLLKGTYPRRKAPCYPGDAMLHLACLAEATLYMRCQTPLCLCNAIHHPAYLMKASLPMCCLPQPNACNASHRLALLKSPLPFVIPTTTLPVCCHPPLAQSDKGHLGHEISATALQLETM